MNSNLRLIGFVLSFLIGIALAMVALLNYKFGLAFLILILAGTCAGIIARTDDKAQNNG